MFGYYVVAFYQGNFSYRYVTENSTTVYDDKIITVVDTEEQALAMLSLLEEGYKLGWSDGYEQAEYDYCLQADYKN
jgi:hypothetical protein